MPRSLLQFVLVGNKIISVRDCNCVGDTELAGGALTRGNTAQCSCYSQGYFQRISELILIQNLSLKPGDQSQILSLQYAINYGRK